MDEIMRKLAAYPPEDRLAIVEKAFADSRLLNRLQYLLEDKADHQDEPAVAMRFKLDDDGKAIGWVLESRVPGENPTYDVRQALQDFFNAIDPENDMFGDAGL